MTQPKTVVVRNGGEIIISFDDLVPGDVVMLEEGNKVPADATLIQGK